METSVVVNLKDCGASCYVWSNLVGSRARKKSLLDLANHIHFLELHVPSFNSSLCHRVDYATPATNRRPCSKRYDITLVWCHAR